MYQVYVLKLENNKYFIGHTMDTKNIIKQIENYNIDWIIKHPFIKILKIYNNCDKFDVNKYTKKYMELYGIDNVRGGSYYHVELPDTILTQLEREFSISESGIYKVEKSSSSDEGIEDSFDKIEQEFEIINKCSRCGSNDHYSYQCYEEFNPDDQIKRCRKCKEYGHLKTECPITKQQLILENFQKLDNKIVNIINKLKGK